MSSVAFKTQRLNRKTVAICVDAIGRVVVKAPVFYTDEQIWQFVASKQDWIKRKLSQIACNTARFENVLNNRETLCFGKPYRIFPCNIRQTAVDEASHRILIPDRCCLSLVRLNAELKKWHSHCLEMYLNERLPQFANRMQVSYQRVQLTNARGKWGSCNSRQDLMFNWRLAMLPPYLIDYVIVHELSHISELNHSKRFWSIVSQYEPNYQSLRKELQQYACLMDLYRNSR